MDVIRILIFAVMVAILASLGNALFHLSKGDSDKKMVRALTVRITLSLVLFLLLMAAWWAGVLKPNQYGRVPTGPANHITPVPGGGQDR